MVHYPLAAVASLASLASLAVALPLNINLGAYSPALVVGDGEISFGGKQDVSSLMNVLEGAAVSAAASVTRTVGSTVAAATGDVSVTAADAASSDPTLQEQAQQISALQGLGKEKEIAPRVQLIDTADATPDEDTSVAKRDLASFDRALKYAEAALQKGPKVQLGTGVEGSGVGIIVDNNQEAAARKGKGVAKRDSEGVSSALAPKRVRAKVTTMYVRSGVPASLQRSSVARTAPRAAAPANGSPATRRSDAIDEVNLNVDGDQGVTMTFVETAEDDDE